MRHPGAGAGGHGRAREALVCDGRTRETAQKNISTRTRDRAESRKVGRRKKRNTGAQSGAHVLRDVAATQARARPGGRAVPRARGVRGGVPCRGAEGRKPHRGATGSRVRARRVANRILSHRRHRPRVSSFSSATRARRSDRFPRLERPFLHTRRSRSPTARGPCAASPRSSRRSCGCARGRSSWRASRRRRWTSRRTTPR